MATNCHVTPMILNNDLVWDSTDIPTTSATEMVVTRSKSIEIGQKQEEQGSSSKHNKAESTSRKILVEVLEPDPRGFMQKYGAITYGSP